MVEVAEQGKSLTKKLMERLQWRKKLLVVVTVLGKWVNCELLVAVRVRTETGSVVGVWARTMSVCMWSH